MFKSVLFATLTLFSFNCLADDILIDDALVVDSSPQPAAPASKGQVVLTKDNVVVMNDVFLPTVVAQVTQKARDMDSLLPSNEPIYVILDSPGGSIEAGIEFINNLNSLNRPVHTITIFAASMGFQTVQGVNGKRYILPQGTLMSHRARGAFSGEFPGQLDSRYNYYLKRVSAMDATAVSRTEGKYDAASYANLIRDEFWCDGKECVDKGFADEVVTPVCDGSLQGTTSEDQKFIFMGMPITVTLIKSKCPLVTGILDFKISVGGESIFKDAKDYSYDGLLIKMTKEDFTKLQTKVDEILNSRANQNKNILKY